jgi:16S rRNA A1518/A1519 N6-dimethyltransferase RsmA/KsgA/DIM1 with predicted DNA glycosylase/AP lyase activity
MNLAAHYKLKSAEPFILPHLNLDSYFLDEAIEATATIGGAETAPRLVQLINQLVDIEDRTNRPLSKQNVFEEKAAQAKTYWLGLKALGNLPYDQSADLLLKATHDFAPDKRQQALASLVHIATDSAVSDRRQQIVDSVRAGLADPAPSVRVAALSGVEKLAVLDLIPEAVRMTSAKENAVVRQARRTLAHLAQDGHGALVTQSLKSALASERDAFRRQRLGSLLDDVSQR